MRDDMRIVVFALAALLLTGCASMSAPPPAAGTTRFFADARFRAPSERVEASDIFALSPQMRQFIEDEIAEPARRVGRQRALLDALQRGKLKLEYDTERTRTAAQAFAARSGNCLSLVLMTASFARALELPVTYQKVFVADDWARSGDIYLAIGHVNLTLGRRATDGGSSTHRVGAKPQENEGMTIDFQPPEDMRRMRTRPIDEDVLVAMYMNNRAVEALALGNTDDAYWWARGAIVQAPGFLMPYNTLGAVYQRHGAPADAERVLAYVVEREPANAEALSNLVSLLQALGRTEEAQQLAARLQRMDPDPAFSHYKRGLAALRDGDLQTAKASFAREVARAPEYHEFHFWLAVTYFGLGEVVPARHHLTLAMKNSTTRRDHDLYAAKLDRLNQAH
jgi:tetratricopeptide (TPR) repeat protein